MAIDETLKAALEHSPDVRLAVLFGSTARGTARHDSDIDVGVLLRDGAEALPLEIALGGATGRAVAVAQLDTAPPLLRFEIARDGRVLVEREPYAWADFRVRAMLDWWDWAPTAHLMHATAIRRLREQVDRGSS